MHGYCLVFLWLPNSKETVARLSSKISVGLFKLQIIKYIDGSSIENLSDKLTIMMTVMNK